MAREAARRAAAMPGASAQRLLVLAILAGTALATGPGVADTYNLPKFALLIVFATGLMLISGWRVVRTGAVVVPRGALGWMIAAFGTALVVVTAAAPRWRLAAVGAYGRYDGLLTMFACVIVFLTVMRVFDARSLQLLAAVLIATGLVVVLVTIVEAAHRHQSTGQPPVRGTIGNPDFLAAYLAIIAPVALGAALDAGRRGGWRFAAGIATVLLVVASVLTGAQQGVVAAALGCTATVLVCAGHRFPSRRRSLLWVTAVVVAGVAILGIGLAGAGPLRDVGTQHTVVVRRLYWHVALRMFAAHPVTGVGPGFFGDHYFHFWSVRATNLLGPGRFADAAHDVPLTMLAEGGLLLGLAYAGFVTLIGSRLAARAWRGGTAQPALLAGMAGGWVAYQASSLVSIDKITLVVLNWTLAAAIVVLTGPMPVATLAVSRRRPGDGVRRASRLPGVTTAVAGAVAIVVLFVPLVDLLRADSAYAAARRDTLVLRAASAAHHASALAPWQPAYADEEGRALGAAGDFPGAVAAFERALRADPSDRAAALGLGAADVAEGRLDEAQVMYERLMRTDVHDPAVLIGVAVLDLRRGATDAAVRALRAAQELHRSRAAARLLRLAQDGRRQTAS